MSSGYDKNVHQKKWTEIFFEAEIPDPDNQYASRFAEEEIDFDQLRSLDENLVSSILSGLKVKRGHVIKFLIYLKRNQATPPGEPTTSQYEPPTKKSRIIDEPSSSCLEGLKMKPDEAVRRLFYVELANSEKLSDLFHHLVSTMKNFFGEYCLSNCSDVLVSFVKEKNVVKMPNDLTGVMDVPAPKVTILGRCLHKPIEISEDILEKHYRNAACSTLKKIGYQHVASHNMVDISSGNDSSVDGFVSSDSSSVSDIIETPMTKEEKREFNILLKTCQLKIKQACEVMLSLHQNNHRNLKYGKKTQTMLKIIILFPKNCENICRIIATHTGLVFIENLFDDVKDEAKNQKLHENTVNAGSKLYSLIQNYVCRKLVLGCNNITLTCDRNIYMNVSSEVKLMIFEELDRAVELDLKPTSHMFIQVQKESTFLHYLQAVSYALNECLEYTTSVSVVYCVEKKDPHKVEYYRCLAPAVGIIPYYILKFVCAKSNAESEKKSLFG